MREYVELQKTPDTRVIEGRMGLSLVYKVRKVFTNTGTVDMTPTDVFYSKETKGLVSCKGQASKAIPLTLDKYGKYTLREKQGRFSRSFKVHADEIAYAAANLV